MSCNRHNSLLLAVVCVGLGFLGLPKAHADTPITDFVCLTDNADVVQACYRFYRLDLDSNNGSDDVEWETSRRLATEKRCPDGQPCEGQDGFLATITDEEQNEFLRGQAIIAQDAGNFPPDTASAKECWIGGQRDPSWHMQGDNNSVWGQWINNAGDIPDNNVSLDFANWGEDPDQPNEPNNAGGNENELAWNRYGLQPAAEKGLFNDEGAGKNQVFCYIAQFGPRLPGENQTLLTANQTGNPEATGDVEEPVNVAGFTCTLKEPKHRKKFQNLRLDRMLKRNPDCAEIVARLPARSRAILPWWLRAFPNTLNNNKKEFAVTLVETSAPGGGSAANALRGPVSVEYRAEASGIDPRSCTDTGGLAVGSTDSPATAGIDLAGSGVIDRRLFLEDGFCNRPRSDQKFSPVLTAYPLSVVANGALLLPAADLRVLETIGDLLVEGCVNQNFLVETGSNYLAASQLANSGDPAGIDALEDVIRFVFNTPGYVDPYGACPNNPLGALAADIVPTPFIAYRYRQNPEAGSQPYVQPFDIRCELLPTLSGDVAFCSD